MYEITKYTKGANQIYVRIFRTVRMFVCS